MNRIPLVALALFCAAGLPLARAQLPTFPKIAAPAASPPAPAPGPIPAPASSSLTPAQAQQALDVLKDDAKRAQVVGVLEAITKAMPVPPGAATPAAADAKLPIPLAPDSLGAQVLEGASERIDTLTRDVVVTARKVNDFPLVWRWLAHVTTDPEAQAAIFDTLWRLGAVLAVAIGLEWVVARLVRRPMRALEARAPEGQRAVLDPETEAADAPAGSVAETRKRRPSPLTLLRRVPYVLGHFALDALPVLTVAAAGFAMLGTGIAPSDTTRLAMLAALQSYVVLRAILCLVRLIMAPGAPRLRILHCRDETAAYVLRWVRTLAAVAASGYAVTEIALLFGLYRDAHDVLLKLVALVDHVFLVVIVLQKQGPVAEWLRARPGKRGFVAIIRNRFAAVWHVVAIFYIVALWLVWAFEVPNGFSRLLHIFLSTLIVASLARLLAILLVGALDRSLKISPELAARYPGLESRARTYHPMVRALASALVAFAAVVVLFQSWGIDALAWFSAGALGTRLVSASVAIGITLLLSLVVWEGFNVAIQRHLARLARDAQAARSARIRTLLPMFRTTLLVTIITVAALMTLSEIGVNIAPLLAGAGVIGLAIGFGSQKLVQDIITGLFLLLEDAMQVGDVVSLGGLSGTVENLSIRTIRLRALDGSVHIVPFSAVTTVTNMTRDYSYAMLDVSIGLNEAPDRISTVLREVAKDMRDEPRWESALRDELDVMGVEKFIDTAWVLRVRIKTAPSQRWAVARELNRRIKNRFDELAIESPFTSYRVLSATPGPTAAAAAAAEPTTLVESHA